jgi:hypothetical protein
MHDMKVQASVQQCNKAKHKLTSKQGPHKLEVLYINKYIANTAM